MTGLCTRILLSIFPPDHIYIMIHVIRLVSLLSRGRHLPAFVVRKASSHIPDEPIWKQITETDLPPPTKVSLELAKRLERLSFVNFESTKAVERLESAIRFADQIQLANTEDVAPMVTVLEDIELPMREDEVVESNPSLVSLAKESFEGYYVSPAGNVIYYGDDIPDYSKKVE